MIHSITPAEANSKTSPSGCGLLSISQSALAENYCVLAAKAPNSLIAPAVKANAYGLGIELVAPILWEQGARQFFVAHVQEGVALRILLPQAKIYVLHGALPGEEEVCIAAHLTPVLNGLGALQRWTNVGSEFVVHVDTGLNRLGFNAPKLDDAVAELRQNGHHISMLISHLACADTPNDAMNAQQRFDFLAAARKCPDAKLSLAASDGIFCGADFHFDMVRPGAALYGLNPTPAQPNPMRPVVSLSVPILQMRTVFKTGTVGYRATRTVSPGQRLASVALGYADGFFRSLSDTGYLYYQNQALPVLGRVSMDIVTVDISGVPENALHDGDRLEVFGPAQTPDELAAMVGTIGYEVLTSLGHRFKRVAVA